MTAHPTARFALAAFLLLSLAAAAIVALKPDRGLLDFGAFYMAGVTQEEGLNPYGVYPELAAQTGEHFGHEDDRGHSPNLNPPISLYPARLLANADPGNVRFALNLVSAAIFAGCAIALLRAYPQHRTLQCVLWIAALGGFWYTLWLGQVYVLLFAIGLGAWFAIDRGSNPLLAAVLIGLLVAVKPHFALWPLFLLLAGHPRIALPSFGVAAAISAVPLLLEGPGIYRQWLEAAEAYPRLALAGNASMVGEAARLGVIEAGYVLSAALVLAAGAFVWRARLPATQTSAWAIVVALLASPIAWIGYGLLAMPVLLVRPWRVAEWAIALGMTGLWFALGIGEPVFVATAALLVLLVRDPVTAGALGPAVQDHSKAATPQAQAAA